MTLDEGFALDEPTFTAILGSVLTAADVVVLPDAFALLAGIAAAAFFMTGFATDLLEADLVATDFAFFSVIVVFAVFFIAFAMESIPTGLLSCAEGIALGGAYEPIVRLGPAYARATLF